MMNRSALVVGLMVSTSACGPPTQTGNANATRTSDAGQLDVGDSEPDAGVSQETGLVGTWMLESEGGLNTIALAFRADGQMLELEFGAGCSTTASVPYVYDGESLSIDGEPMGVVRIEDNDRLIINPPGSSTRSYLRTDVPCHTLPVAWSVAGEWEFVEPATSGPKGFVITAYGQFFRLKRSRYCLPYKKQRYIMLGREEEPNLIVLDPGNERSEQLAHEVRGDELALGEGSSARILRRVDNGCIGRLRFGSTLRHGMSGTWGNRSMRDRDWFILHLPSRGSEAKISYNPRSCEVSDTFQARSYDGQRHDILWIDLPDNYTGTPLPGATFFEWVKDDRYTLRLIPIYSGDPPPDGGSTTLTAPPCGM